MCDFNNVTETKHSNIRTLPLPFKAHHYSGEHHDTLHMCVSMCPCVVRIQKSVYVHCVYMHAGFFVHAAVSLARKTLVLHYT
jgi:hypothetical protein